MQNSRLDEAQAGIKIAGININNLKYVDDITLVVLMKVKEVSEKVGLYSTFKKLRSWHPVPSQQIDGETMETVRDFIFLGSRITADGECSHEMKRRLLQL